METLPGFQNRQISVTKGGGMPYTIAAAKTPVMYIILPLSQWLQILYSCRMLKSYTLIPVEKNKTNILKKYYTALLCSLCLTKIFQNHKLVFSLKNSKCLIARTKFYSPFIKGVKNNPVFPAGLQRLYLYTRALWQ